MKKLLTLGLAALLSCSSPTAPVEPVKDYSFTFNIRVSFFQQVRGKVDRLIEARGELFNEGEDLVLKPELRLYTSQEKRDNDNWFYKKSGHLGTEMAIIETENQGFVYSYYALADTVETLKANESLYHFTLSDTLHYKGLIYWRFKFKEDKELGKNPLEKIIEGELK